MSTKVKIGHLLQEYLEIPSVLEVEGKTVGQCINNLIKQYPEIRNWLYDQNSLLRVLITINNVEVVTPDKEGFDRILKDQDDLQIFAQYGAIEPPQQPRALLNRVAQSTLLRPCVDALATCIAGFGYRLECMIDPNAPDFRATLSREFH